ncbi:hypothetical protein BJX64DRAFT_287473 [Aspergillus heterothallicus]
MGISNMMHLFFAIWLAILAVGAKGLNPRVSLPLPKHQDQKKKLTIVTRKRQPCAHPVYYWLMNPNYCDLTTENYTLVPLPSNTVPPFPGNTFPSNNHVAARGDDGPQPGLQDWRYWFETYIPLPVVQTTVHDPVSTLQARGVTDLPHYGLPTRPAPVPTVTHVGGGTWNHPVDENGLPLPAISFHPHKSAVNIVTPVPSPTHISGGETWNHPIDDNSLPIPGIPFHPHKSVEKREESHTETVTSTATHINPGDTWNNPHDENGLPLPGFPFLPGHGHFVDSSEHTESVSPSPTHISAGDTWNNPHDENGLPLPGFPFLPGHGHFLDDSDNTQPVPPSPTHINPGDTWNNPHDENGLPLPGFPFLPGHGHFVDDSTNSKRAVPSPTHINPGDTWNNPHDENGLPLPGFPFLPGHGHYVDDSIHPATPSPTHINPGDTWNNPHDENGLPIPGFPFLPGHGHFVDKPSDSDESSTTTNTITKRDDTPIHTLYCYSDDLAPANSIRYAIRALRRKRGCPWSGLKECHRVWCQQDLCVSWCNDFTRPRPICSFNNIADGLQTILDGCPAINGDISGQLDHPDGWRVVVHKHACKA